MDDRVFMRRAWISLLWLLPLPVAVEATGIDMWLEQSYFDSAQQTFPWRHVWWFNVFLHDGLRSLLVFVAVGIAGMLLLRVLAPEYLEPYLAPERLRPRMLVYLLVAMLAGPLVIALLKQVMARPCPWSLAIFGGEAPYLSVLTPPIFDWHAPGKCFPGAHASGGFGLLAFVPLLSGRRRVLMLAGAVLLGLLMGWTRMMQGAHFLSHNLWSAWICWAATLLSVHLIRPGEHDNDGTTKVRELG